MLMMPERLTEAQTACYILPPFLLCLQTQIPVHTFLQSRTVYIHITCTGTKTNLNNCVKQKGKKKKKDCVHVHVCQLLALTGSHIGEEVKGWRCNWGFFTPLCYSFHFLFIAAYSIPPVILDFTYLTAYFYNHYGFIPLFWLTAEDCGKKNIFSL